MSRSKPSLPTGRMASDAHRERMREMAERKREIAEKKEIEEAMREQALARDPTKAGANLKELDRQSGFVPGCIEVVKDSSGRPFRIERTPNNVFNLLGKVKFDKDGKRIEPTLSEDMVNAGNRLVEIWAGKQGLAGSSDADISRDIDRVDCSTASNDFLTSKMHRSIKKWQSITREFGTHSKWPAVFESLCQDIMETEATPNLNVIRKGDGTVIRETQKSRWRSIINQAFNEPNKDAQAGLVRSGCEELAKILEAVEGIRA